MIDNYLSIFALLLCCRRFNWGPSPLDVLAALKFGGFLLRLCEQGLMVVEDTEWLGFVPLVKRGLYGLLIPPEHVFHVHPIEVSVDIHGL